MSDNPEQLKEDIREKLFKAVILQKLMAGDTKEHINSIGVFEIGGPQGDAGLAGCKIIVDNYGGMQDTVVEYFQEKTAPSGQKCILHGKIHCKKYRCQCTCRKCEIHLSYAISVAESTSIMLMPLEQG